MFAQVDVESEFYLYLSLNTVLVSSLKVGHINGVSPLCYIIDKSVYVFFHSICTVDSRYLYQHN